VPDTYRGTELWDYAMVDPDNRRSVDFARRIDALNSLRETATSPEALMKLFESWPDGRIKLLVVSRLLRLRRRQPDLFLAGSYHPLAAEGPRTDHLCAFARIAGAAALLVVVPRFFVSLTDGRAAIPARPAWAETTLAGPTELADRRWVNLLTGDAVSAEQRDGAPMWRVDALLGALPFGIWLAEEGPGAANTTPG
jgi:(1->4)-alpha-D-glucan 1-alpha-D-glucosylmutase